jgi:signal transduction histidine kinase
MNDVLDDLRAAIALESAAIAPRTSKAIEAMKRAVEEIERLQHDLDRALDNHTADLNGRVPVYGSREE